MKAVYVTPEIRPAGLETGNDDTKTPQSTTQQWLGDRGGESMLETCPKCGSTLTCDRSPGAVWCVSTECGAVFRDLDLGGLSGSSQADPEKPTKQQPTDDRTR